jgi:hypothetical protein
MMVVPVDAEEVIAWAKAFAFTQAVEVPIYRWGAPTQFRYAFLASAITHPFVWFVFPRISTAFAISWTVIAIASEIFAWLVEAVLMKRVVPNISWRRAMLISLMANGSSLGLGLALRELTGWI